MNQDRICQSYEEITNMYLSHKYTQQEIADSLNFPVHLVSKCTQNLGFRNTKAKNGIKPIYFINDLICIFSSKR